MWDKLEQVFKELGVKYGRQGSYSTDKYPPSFFTFWNIDVPEVFHYDNKAHGAVWDWQICYYTKDPSTMYSMMDAFTKKAKEYGFICEGRGNDTASDRPDYVGRTVRIKYIEGY